jgi:RNAse (barnase) inhibitor barstar
MHQFLLGKPKNENNVIDHIDNNGLNNTRENLRFTTYSGNNQNKKKLNEGTSKYFGVHFSTKAKKWISKSAGIQLGTFTDEIEAAKKYDTFAMLKYGKEAATNNLIKYEDIKDIDIDSLIAKKTQKILKNITINKNYYKASLQYNNKKFSSCCTTLEEAKEKLEEHLKLPIIRNKDSKAILTVKDKNGKIIGEPVVDDDKWHELSFYTWSKFKEGDYYHTYKDGKYIKLHRYLTNAKLGQIIDHINNKNNTVLNNTLENLRINDYSGNAHNKKVKKLTNNYIGVNFDKTKLKWRAQIKKGKSYYLGRYDIEVKAAIAYNIKAVELYGNLANLNIIPQDEYKNYFNEVNIHIKNLVTINN